MQLEPFHGPIYVVARDGRVRVFDTIADAHAKLEPDAVEDDGIEAIVDDEGRVFTADVVELPAPAGRGLFGHNARRQLRSVRLRPGSLDPNAPAYLRKVLGRKRKVF
jgi:hypothetical protein